LYVQELNNTGRILYTEFLACTLEAKGPIQQHRIQEVFEQIDYSSKGHISQQDLRRILPKTFTEKDIQSLFSMVNASPSSIGTESTLSWEKFHHAVNGEGLQETKVPYFRSINRRILLPRKHFR
jgi:hypothetical protein